jgi:hypothetical protein
LKDKIKNSPARKQFIRKVEEKIQAKINRINKDEPNTDSKLTLVTAKVTRTTTNKKK